MTLKNRKLIAKGATADVYEWDDDQVLKLFSVDFPQKLIDREYKIAKSIASAGVDTPAPIDMKQVDEHMAIVYERVYGEEVDALLLQNLWRVRPYMRQMAVTLADLHSKHIDIELTPLVDNYTWRLERAPVINDTTRTRLIEHLHSLPTRNAVCHGDYHLKNVMISDKGAIIIDWLTAVRGNPLMDVARTYIVLSEDYSHELPRTIRWLYPPLKALMLNTFVKHYFTLTGANWDEVQVWLPITAAVRLTEASAQVDDLLPFIEQWENENF